MSCCAVVLPALPLPPPPACCLSCCHRVVACRAVLWCCPPCHRCLRAACCVAVRWLHVVPHCGTAHVATAATTCVLPVVLLSGSCMSCHAVVLPALPLLPAHCLLCRRWAVACHAVLWCYPHCHHHCHLHTACHVAIGWLRVVPRCGAAHIAAAAATCTLPVMLLLGGVVLQGAAAHPHPATIGQLHVVWRCAAACTATTAAATLLIVSLSGSCMSSSGVLLPMLPPRCSSCCCHVAATVAVGATGLCLYTQSDE